MRWFRRKPGLPAAEVDRMLDVWAESEREKQVREMLIRLRAEGPTADWFADLDRRIDGDA